MSREQRKAETDAEYYQKNKEKKKARALERYQKDPETKKIYAAKRRKQIDNHALLSLKRGEVEDVNLWHKYCNKIRSSAKDKKPYSEEFTDDMIWEMMNRGCVYCGDLATTIDRVNSNIDHIPDNCVGSCEPCNYSKGNGDVDSFLRKTFFRARGKYFDDEEDIWSDNNNKPRRDKAEAKAKKVGSDFSLTQDVWDSMVVRDCVYCKRNLPDGKWNGVDQIVPSGGYTIENTATCCDDCNVDKFDYSAEATKFRNDKIASRMEIGKITLSGCQKVLRNRGR